MKLGISPEESSQQSRHLWIRIRGEFKFVWSAFRIPGSIPYLYPPYTTMTISYGCPQNDRNAKIQDNCERSYFHNFQVSKCSIMFYIWLGVAIVGQHRAVESKCDPLQSSWHPLTCQAIWQSVARKFHRIHLQQFCCRYPAPFVGYTMVDNHWISLVVICQRFAQRANDSQRTGGLCFDPKLCSDSVYEVNGNALSSWSLWFLFHPTRIVFRVFFSYLHSWSFICRFEERITWVRGQTFPNQVPLMKWIICRIWPAENWKIKQKTKIDGPYLVFQVWVKPISKPIDGKAIMCSFLAT